MKKRNVVIGRISILVILLGLLIALIDYGLYSQIMPASGGRYVEGVIGQPRFINPIYAIDDADRDLTEITFSGLLKYSANGELVNDLLENYYTDDYRTYYLELKSNLFWSDGQPLTADDVVFTVRTIQDGSYKSPLRPAWVGIDVEKIDDLKIKFTLEKTSTIFPENLTIKIVPRHIWGEIMPQNLVFSEHNIRPISSGPYRVKDIRQDRQDYITSISLEPNPHYHGSTPFIREFIFKFFRNENDLKRASVSGSTIQQNKLTAHSVQLPRYFAVFLNPNNNPVFNDENVRHALNISLDKEQMVVDVLQGDGRAISSPLLNYSNEYSLEKAEQLLAKADFQGGEKIVKEEKLVEFKKDLKIGDKGDEVRLLQQCLIDNNHLQGSVSGFFGPETKDAVISFQEEYRDDVLVPGGLSKGTGTVSANTRKKLNELCGHQPEEIVHLSFKLTTVDQPRLKQTAEWLKEAWAKIGVQVEIEVLDIQTLERDVIKTRQYDALLFGNALRLLPDLLPFFHSSQVKDLNLSLYDNKNVDRWLEEARTKKDNTDILDKIEDQIQIDQPAIFIYTPDYIYYSTPRLLGFSAQRIVDPSRRFLDIEKWHLKTTRRR